MMNLLHNLKLKEKRVNYLQMEILRRIILHFMEKLVWRQRIRRRTVLLVGNIKPDREKDVERQEERMMLMLMMKVMKVLKGQQRIVRMHLRMVMFLEVSLVMVKIVLGKSMRKMVTMRSMILKLRVKVRLKEWLMPMMLKEMEQCYHFQNDFF
jgi:hypothetical protein